VFGLLGLQPQALPHFDNALNEDAISARLNHAKQPPILQVLKEN